jgi:hypothetical protein
MDKENVKSTISDSIVVEEMAIPIYERHLQDSLFWSPFTDEEEKYIKESLARLVVDSKKHVEILQKLNEMA